jgi:hypothetical protein
MKKVIVSTSINKPTEAIKKFDSLKDWLLIVVGDKKTPKNYKLKNGIYLSVKDQKLIDKKLSDIIGWNCIERRNLGLVFAKNLGAEIVALVDDDNIPYKHWGQNIFIGKEINAKEYNISSEVFDPISVTQYKNLWHRGFPIDQLDNRKIISTKIKKIRVDVQVEFWNGDPDIDAICRMIHKPKCLFNKKDFPFYSKKISPFNSQNSILDSRLLPDYFLFPDQDRMHDIWASYYLQYKKKTNVVYFAPSVFQKRNKHNLITDLKNELIGLKYNSRILESIKKKNFNIKNFFSKKSIAAYKQYLTHF